MRLRFNPKRAIFLSVLFGLWVLCRHVADHVHIGSIRISLAPLDQKHTVAALAVLAIGVVGLFRLLRR